MEVCSQNQQSCQPVPMSHEAINASFSEMVEDKIFDPVKRHLGDAFDAEDRFQEGMCMIYDDYRRAAERGKPTDRAALVYGLKLKSFDVTHRFTRTGHGRRRDVLGSPACVLDGIKVLRFDGLADEEDGPYDDLGVSHDNPMSFVTEVSLRQTADVENRLNSAIDLEEWLADLDSTDRDILQGRMEGRAGTEIAEWVGMSMSNCYRRLKELGRQLAVDTGMTCYLEPQPGAA